MRSVKLWRGLLSCFGYVLTYFTGSMVSELVHGDIGSGNDVFNLDISGKTLIVPTYGREGPILFYRLND